MRLRKPMKTIYLDVSPLQGMIDCYTQEPVHDTVKNDLILAVVESCIYGYVAVATGAAIDQSTAILEMNTQRARQLNEILHDMIYHALYGFSFDVADSNLPQHSHFTFDWRNPYTLIVYQIPLGDEFEDPAQHLRNIVQESEARGDWIPERLRKMVGEL